MRYYIKALWWAVFCGIFFLAGELVSHGSCDMTTVILHLGFEGIDYQPPQMVRMIFRYMPLLLFQILYSTYIYRHFCSGGLYFFSRNQNRIKWYVTESIKLYGYTVAYLVLMVITGITAAGVFVHVEFERISLIVAGYYLLIHSLFLFVATMAINLLAILFSSNIAFIAVEGLCMLEMCIYTGMGEYLEENFILNHPWLFKLNPIVHLILPLHSSVILDVDALININDMQFDLNASVILYFFTSLIVLYAGCRIVKNYEFVMSEPKMEGK